MEGDRLSSLPDDTLHSILRALPFKAVVRTSGVSRRFAKTWHEALASSPVLDFTDRDFMISGSSQTLARAVATVERCLQRHFEKGGPLHVLRVVLDGALGGVTAFGQDVVRWVVSVVARGAREVEVDLTPVRRDGAAVQLDADNEIMFLVFPGNLFMTRNSLVRLVLDRFSLRTVPASAPGLMGLQSLFLSRADVTDEGIQTVLSSCQSLEFLSLRRCHLLKSVRIIGDKVAALGDRGLPCRAAAPSSRTRSGVLRLPWRHRQEPGRQLHCRYGLGRHTSDSTKSLSSTTTCFCHPWTSSTS